MVLERRLQKSSLLIHGSHALQGTTWIEQFLFSTMLEDVKVNLCYFVKGFFCIAADRQACSYEDDDKRVLGAIASRFMYNVRPVDVYGLIYAQCSHKLMCGLPK